VNSAKEAGGSPPAPAHLRRPPQSPVSQLPIPSASKVQPVRPQKRPPHPSSATNDIVSPAANANPPSAKIGIPPFGCVPTHTSLLQPFENVKVLAAPIPAGKKEIPPQSIMQTYLQSWMHQQQQLKAFLMKLIKLISVCLSVCLFVYASLCAASPVANLSETKDRRRIVFTWNEALESANHQHKAHCNSCWDWGDRTKLPSVHGWAQICYKKATTAAAGQWAKWWASSSSLVFSFWSGEKKPLLQNQVHWWVASQFTDTSNHSFLLVLLASKPQNTHTHTHTHTDKPQILKLLRNHCLFKKGVCNRTRRRTMFSGACFSCKLFRASG